MSAGAPYGAQSRGWSSVTSHCRLVDPAVYSTFVPDHTVRRSAVVVSCRSPAQCHGVRGQSTYFVGRLGYAGSSKPRRAAISASPKGTRPRDPARDSSFDGLRISRLADLGPFARVEQLGLVTPGRRHLLRPGAVDGFRGGSCCPLDLRVQTHARDRGHIWQRAFWSLRSAGNRPGRAEAVARPPTDADGVRAPRSSRFRLYRRQPRDPLHSRPSGHVSGGVTVRPSPRRGRRRLAVDCRNRCVVPRAQVAHSDSPISATKGPVSSKSA